MALDKDEYLHEKSKKMTACFTQGYYGDTSKTDITIFFKEYVSGSHHRLGTLKFITNDNAKLFLEKTGFKKKGEINE